MERNQLVAARDTDGGSGSPGSSRGSARSTSFRDRSGAQRELPRGTIAARSGPAHGGRGSGNVPKARGGIPMRRALLVLLGVLALVLGMTPPASATVVQVRGVQTPVDDVHAAMTGDLV